MVFWRDETEACPKSETVNRFYKPSKHKNEAKASMISAMSYFSHFKNIKIDEICVIITQELLKIRVLSWPFCNLHRLSLALLGLGTQLMEVKTPSQFSCQITQFWSSGSLLFFPSGIRYRCWSTRLWFFGSSAQDSPKGRTWREAEFASPKYVSQTKILF